jgi:hypothetical protein
MPVRLGPRNLPIESVVTLSTLCDAGSDVRSFASLRMTGHEKMTSEFVGSVRAEDELELQKNGIDLAIGEEEVRLQKIVIVLQS